MKLPWVESGQFIDMGKFWTQDKLFVLLVCALMWPLGAAERLFFLQSSNATWDEARSHCQACFKDLVTLTPEDIQIIVRNLSLDYWVGLRKNFTSMAHSSVFWSRWANGDPLTFQNWFPGQPVLKSRLPKTHCSSCTYISPATTPGAQSGRTPEESPDGNSDADKDYIEDACVVMLHFGAWVEKNCSERLPYICYDELFHGQAQVMGVTSTNATVSWKEGPGDITHYRVEVRTPAQRTGQTSSLATNSAAMNLTRNLTTTHLSLALHSLVAGSQYWVQVFAVKCGRDLNPQNISFFTIPRSVENLRVTHVTDTSISLRWEKPDGNADAYVIESLRLTTRLQVYTEGVNISNLVPGNPYTFSVYTRVIDGFRWSKAIDISAHTKPHRVSNLWVSDSDDDSMLVKWDLLAGDNSGFLITVSWNDTENRSVDVNRNKRQYQVQDLPPGTAITVSVTALADNNTLHGEEATVVSYTAPQRTSMVTLKTTSTEVTAMWNYPEGDDYSFIVELWLNDNRLKSETTSNIKHHFESLKAATNYSVFVYSVNGHGRSKPTTQWNFTLPVKPAHLTTTHQTKNQITIQWDMSEDATTSKYRVRLKSDFWGQFCDYSVEGNSFTAKNLTSGTRYHFEVRGEAGGVESEAAINSYSTDADEREIILSMMCSSETPLHCDEVETRNSVFKQLDLHFNQLLKDSVAWKLEKLERANK